LVDCSSKTDVVELSSDTTAREKTDGEVPTDSEGNSSACSVADLKRQKANLQQMIVEKQEILRKLNLVKLHRNKNDLTTLSSLTAKWLSVSRRALVELWQLSPEPRPPMAQLIAHLQLDPQMIGFSAATDSFT